MTTEEKEPARLHPAMAAPLLPFVLLYEGARWVGHRVTTGLPHVARFLAWVFTPVRLVAEPVGRLLARVGHACRRVLERLADAMGPPARFVAAPFLWLGRGFSRVLWKLDHAVSRAWQRLSSVRLALARVADAVLRATRKLGSAAMAPFRPMVRAARRVGAAVRTFAARVRRTFR